MNVRILQGDCRDVLKTLPDESVDCVVTSPPYFGLRDYGVSGQIGLELEPQDYVAELVAVFQEVRRVLADWGTVWLNLGDSYAGSGKGGNPPDSPHQKQATNAGSLTVIGNTAREAAVTKGAGDNRVPRGSTLPAGLHESARLAGNIGRAWVKPPAGLKQKDLMGIPWLVAFALRADGWWLRQDIIWAKPNPMPESVQDRCTKAHEYIFLLAKSDEYFYNQEAIKEDALTADLRRPYGSPGANSLDPRGQQGNGEPRVIEYTESHNPRRNKRSVWTIPTQGYSGAHFATFPPALIEPCILAGSQIGGTILDPFAGAGTTGLVADRLHRNAILIELNPEYAEMARKRIMNDSPLFTEMADKENAAQVGIDDLL